MGSVVTTEFCYIFQPRDESDSVFYVCKFHDKVLTRSMFEMVHHVAKAHGFKFIDEVKKDLFHPRQRK